MSFFDPLLGRVRSGLRRDKVIERETKVIERRVGSGNPLPSGGATNQVLSKKSTADNDVQWSTPSSGGGTWGTITGTLSAQTDLQTALDTKVDENASISGATKTKITYDAKGLVTAGADATTADIADSLNKRYVTDAQSTVLGNTSGTNTGDQTLPVKASGAEVDTGTDDAKFLTAKAVNDSHNVPDVAPGTSGNVLTSNGTDWTSAAAAGGSVTPTGRLFLADFDKRLIGDTADGVLTKGNTGASSASTYTGSSGGWGLFTGTSSTGTAYINNSKLNMLRGTNNWFGTTLMDRSPVFQCMVAFEVTGTNDVTMWFGMGPNAGAQSVNDATYKSMGFLMRRVSNTVTWYAVTCNGTTKTETDITSSVTASTNYGLDASATAQFMTIVLTSGTNAKFYFNNTLCATVTATLPSGGLDSDSFIYSFIANVSGATNNKMYIPYIGCTFNLF